MRLCLLALVLGYSFTGYSQKQFNDTLFYKSGWDRPCDITEHNEYEVFFTYLNSKNQEKHYSVSAKKLKYFVIYNDADSLTFNSKTTSEKYVSDDTDSLYVAKHILSINPFSLAVLGLNLQYTYRFGNDLNYGIRTTTRFLSPLLFGGFFSQFGVGFVYLPVNNKRFTMTLACTPSVAIAGGESFAFVPVTLGFIRYFTPKIALTGNAGLGPAFNSNGFSGIPFPSAHIGIGFQLGEKEMINFQQL